MCRPEKELGRVGNLGMSLVKIRGDDLKADLHGTTLSHAINLRQVYDMNRFV